MDLPPLDYIPPTPGEISRMLGHIGLTGSQAARLVGLSGSRSIRKYTGGDDPRRMAYATLYTLLHRACGLAITPDRWRIEAGRLLLSVRETTPGADATES